MKTLGITGLIASGKSFVAELLRDSGIPVHDSDKEVAALWQSNSPVFDELCHLFPTALRDHSHNTSIQPPSYQGTIDRSVVADLVFKNPDLRAALENILYPALSYHRSIFIEDHRRQDTPLIALDIPLLFEKNLEHLCDAILATVASEETRKKRALARPNMTQERFISIDSIHLRDKHLQADFVLDTDRPHDIVAADLDAIIKELSL